MLSGAYKAGFNRSSDMNKTITSTFINNSLAYIYL